MIEPYYSEPGIEIYCADCRDVLPQLPKVDLVFTSPPYWNQRQYELKKFDWNNTMTNSIPKVNLSEKGQILVNLGLIHLDKCVFRYWDELINAMEMAKYRLFGWYVWDKLNGLPGDWNGRLAPAHEFIFHFNRRPCKINKTVKTQDRPQRFDRDGLRGKDNQMKKATNDNWGQPYKIPDSVIRLNPQLARGGFADDHPATFPLELPKFIISAFPGETVLDLYMGSGTTLRAAKDLGRKAIGIEIESKYCDIAIQRLKQQVLL